MAYLTSAQLGRPFPVRWVRVNDRDGQVDAVRKQFTTEVTRGKKFEGVFGTDEGVYVVNSFAFDSADLPADAVKRDGMVWFYSYADQTITLVTYFPHQTTAEPGGGVPRYDGVVFDGPDNVTVTPWGTLVLAEDGVGASHVLARCPADRRTRSPATSSTSGLPRRRSFRVHRPGLLLDGKVLFVNVQTPGITLAITGPCDRCLASACSSATPAGPRDPLGAPASGDDFAVVVEDHRCPFSRFVASPTGSRAHRTAPRLPCISLASSSVPVPMTLVPIRPSPTALHVVARGGPRACRSSRANWSRSTNSSTWSGSPTASASRRASSMRRAGVHASMARSRRGPSRSVPVGSHHAWPS